jgi:RNA polymerase sporulation-specific sigma factor
MLNMGLVRSLAIRFRDRGTEMEDLIQIGTIGMIKAIRSFDLSRGTTFSTYAVPLIVGEIRRHLRDDGMIKVSRTYRRIGVALMNAKSRICTEEGRDPTIGELAELCGVSPEEAAIALDATAPISSLSETVYGEEGVTLEGTIADEDNDIDRLSDKIALNQAISRMQPLWQKIVLLRYYRDMTQQQTADRLGLSQVKVSREEKKIMEFLREQLAN